MSEILLTLYRSVRDARRKARRDATISEAQEDMYAEELDWLWWRLDPADHAVLWAEHVERIRLDPGT